MIVKQDLYDEIIHFKKTKQLPARIFRLKKEWQNNARNNFFKQQQNLVYDTDTDKLINSVTGKEVCIPRKIDKTIVDSWKDPAIGLTSSVKLYKKLREKYQNISRRRVDRVLMHVKEYQIGRRVQRKSIVKPVNSKYPFSYVQIDITDLRSLGVSFQNNRYMWLLVGIDVFSRFTFIIPMRKKDVAYNKEGIKQILDFVIEKTDYRIKTIQSDNDPTFLSNEIQDLLSEYNVRHIKSLTYNPASNSKVEKMNGVIKEMMTNYLRITPDKRWIDIIHDINNNINNTETVLGYSPLDIVDGDEDIHNKVRKKQEELSKKMLERHGNLNKEIEVGSVVRLSRIAVESKERSAALTGFRKMNTIKGNYTKEIYVVAKSKFVNRVLSKAKVYQVMEVDKWNDDEEKKNAEMAFDSRWFRKDELLVIPDEIIIINEEDEDSEEDEDDDDEDDSDADEDDEKKENAYKKLLSDMKGISSIPRLKEAINKNLPDLNDDKLNGKIDEIFKMSMKNMSEYLGVPVYKNKIMIFRTYVQKKIRESNNN